MMSSGFFSNAYCKLIFRYDQAVAFEAKLGQSLQCVYQKYHPNISNTIVFIPDFNCVGFAAELKRKKGFSIKELTWFSPARCDMKIYTYIHMHTYIHISSVINFNPNAKEWKSETDSFAVSFYPLPLAQHRNGKYVTFSSISKLVGWWLLKHPSAIYSPYFFK